MDIHEGDVGGRAAGLFDTLYSELRRRAGRLMRGQPGAATLQPTALVNEACMKLMGHLELEQAERGELLALASSAMRSVLIDHARARQRLKRSAPGVRLSLDGLAQAYEERSVDLLALDEALQRLARFDATMARAVELRFFGGLSMSETARTLGVPQRTLERQWQATRAWLRAELGP